MKTNHPDFCDSSQFDVIEQYYIDDSLYSLLIFYKPDNLYCFIVKTIDCQFLYFWFAKRSYISLYYKSLVTPHKYSYYKKHFPFSLLSYRVALQNRPYYMKGCQK